MKHKILSVMSGALVCLSLVFSSCGNIDNPLEEIVNSNPKVAVLADALEDNAEVTVDFKMKGSAIPQALIYIARNGAPEEEGSNLGDILQSFNEAGSIPMRVVFKKVADNNFKLIDASIPGVVFTEEIINNIFRDIAGEMTLEYVSKDNKIKLSIIKVSNVPQATRTEFVELRYPLNTILFDLSDDTFAQYVYPNMYSIILDKIYVNNDDKTDLVKAKYPISVPFYTPLLPAFGTRSLGLVYDAEPMVSRALTDAFSVFYNDGETWADVNKRYKDEAGAALLDEPEDDGFAYLKSSIENDEGVPFFYNEDVDDLSKVKYSEKVGYKGSSAILNGYIMPVRLYPLIEGVVEEVI